MEEHEYQQTYHSLNPHPCGFAKAILSGRWHCRRCQRIHLAEREAVACLATTESCTELLRQLRQNAQFALKNIGHGPLPHTQAMQVQGGGLRGLQAVLSMQVFDIEALVMQALLTFGELEQLPYAEIVKFISHYEARKKPPSLPSQRD